MSRFSVKCLKCGRYFKNEYVVPEHPCGQQKPIEQEVKAETEVKKPQAQTLLEAFQVAGAVQS